MGAWRIIDIEQKRAHILPRTLDELIVAVCADYERRDIAVSSGEAVGRSAMEYKYLNYRIYEGALEVVGDKYARLYINEIGRKVGFAKSAHSAVTERVYKEQKQEVKYSIAKKLHLVE